MTDYALGATAYFMFTSRQFSTGAPFVLAGSPVISAYEDNDTTQITAGVSLGVSHDGVTGLNLVTVVASGANGFEVGKDYHLVVTTGTVDSVSVVGEVVGRFTIGREADALLDRTDGIESGLTVRGALRLNTAALAGKVSGAGTATETFRNAVADSKNRVVSTVDSSGNRTAVTTDVT